MAKRRQQNLRRAGLYHERRLSANEDLGAGADSDADRLFSPVHDWFRDRSFFRHFVIEGVLARLFGANDMLPLRETVKKITVIVVGGSMKKR